MKPKLKVYKSDVYEFAETPNSFITVYTVDFPDEELTLDTLTEMTQQLLDFCAREHKLLKNRAPEVTSES